MVKASNNLYRRLQILKEQIEMLQVCKQNGRRPEKIQIEDCQKAITYCKRLLKEELIKADINSLL